MSGHLGVPPERRKAVKAFTVGDRVETHDWVRPPQHAGRVGTVRTVNRQDGEIGVVFTKDHSESNHWFLPHELARQGERRQKAAERPAKASRGGQDQ